MPPAPNPNYFSAHSTPGKSFLLFSQWNGRRAPDVTQGIYFSEKAESQNPSPSARTSAPSFWGNSESGSTRDTAM